MKVNDAVFGSGLLVFAAAMMLYTRTFPGMPGQAYGPALFPRLIGIGVSICGVLLVVRGWRARTTVPWFELADWVRSVPKAGGVALTLAAVLFYILAADLLGFFLTSLAILLALFLQRGVRLWVATVIGVLAVLAIQQSFVVVLRVPLPRGLLGPWLSLLGW
jgi:putative tricarboxylic transport membrane protein